MTECKCYDNAWERVTTHCPIHKEKKSMAFEVFYPSKPDLSKMSPWERKEYEDSKKTPDWITDLLNKALEDLYGKP